MKPTLFFLTLFLSLHLCHAQENPFIRDLYTADPSAHVWEDGRLYVYASHDVAPPRGCDLMDGYHIFSTDDMINWTDHGEILHSRDVPWGRPEGGFMWAPDCAYKNGKYYYYFPHPSETTWNASWKVGIAISDKPASDFVVQDKYLEVGEDPHGKDHYAMIDPCVFVDDDGQAYFYYGGGDRCSGAKLKDNMVELAEPLRKMEGLNDFHEGAWVFKRNGTYYMMYADNNAITTAGKKRGANRQQYATSDSPLGPWTSRGVILEPTGCDTSHGSIVEYKGQWYMFYHNSTLSGQGNLRSICVDKLYFNEDGSIQKVIQTGMDKVIAPPTAANIPNLIEAENFMNGGEDVAYHDTDQLNDGGAAYRLTGVDLGDCYEDGGFYLTSTQDGEWLKYNVKIANTKTYKLEVRAASTVDGGVMHIEIDDKDVTGPIEIPNTNGEQAWQSVFVHDISLTAGDRVMKVCIDKGGFNINNYMFSFDTPAPVGSKISLSLNTNSMFVTVKENNQLFSDAKTLPLTDRELFLVVDNGDGSISLKGGNDAYVESTSPMVCNRKTIAPANKFVWHSMSTTQVTLRSMYNNMIVCSENGQKAMNCDRSNPGGWEKFIWRVHEVSSIQNPGTNHCDLQLFPIPANDKITVTFNLTTHSQLALKIINLRGNTVKETTQHCEAGANNINIDISDLTAGMYLLQINSSEINTTKTFVIV